MLLISVKERLQFDYKTRWASKETNHSGASEGHVLKSIFPLMKLCQQSEDARSRHEQH